MPRDGSNIYSQPFPDVVEDTTIESTVYNGFTNDVTADLNAPRPIIAGGTGASNADQALVNLGGEKAAMLVTNYDSFIWQAGSFYSAAGATGAPTANAFSGICYGSDAAATPPANLNLVLEARDVTNNKLYVRRKTAGVWAAWSEQASSITDVDTLYVNVTGDTMTGALAISAATPSTSAVTGALTVAGGIGIGGAVSVGSTITGTSLIAASAAAVGTVYFGSNGVHQLSFDGTTYNVTSDPLNVQSTAAATSTITGALRVAGGVGVAGALYVAGNINSGGTTASGNVSATSFTSTLTSTTGVLYLGSNALHSVIFDGTNFGLAGGGGLNCGPVYSSNTIEGIGYKCRSGLSGAFTANYFNIQYSGGNPILFVNDTTLGVFAFTSDYRIKKDVTDLPGMWDAVKTLRPIKYTQAEFSPPSQKDTSAGPMFPADNIERWGFVAHELQQTLIPSAANGVKDSPDTIQSPNPFTLIAALTKALQEAMARIEALEAR